MQAGERKLPKEALRGLRQSAEQMHRAVQRGALGEVVYNLKAWEPDRDVLFEGAFFSHTASAPLARAARRRCVLEPLGTLEGSGCAFINVLKELAPPVAAGPALGLLIAGEGSRLWGLSASLGFIKGLSSVLGWSLVEQTVHQSMLLFAQAPRRDMVVVAGTDNVFLPSQPLAVAGRPFAQCTDAHLFFFSKEVPVLDSRGEVLDERVLRDLTQLGIMLVNDAGEPVLFLEKVPEARIVQVLREHGKRSVYFNTFYFALSRAGAELLTRLYSEPAPSTGRPIYQTNGFDWSTHVLEALAAPAVEAWQARHAAAGSKMWSAEDWSRLWQLAQRFKQELGAPRVVNIGRDAVWFDTGMARDLVDLYQLAVRDGPLQPLIRATFGLPPGKDVIRGGARGVRLPERGRSLLIDADFRRGGSVGVGCVVVNSIFEHETHLPPGTVVVNSHVHSLAANSEPGALLYALHSPSAPVQTHTNATLCSIHLRPPPSPSPSSSPPSPLASSTVESCEFPMSVVPKDSGKEPLLGWYNAGANGGKPYLAQPLRGFREPLSFRDLQRDRRVCLQSTMRFLQTLPAATAIVSPPKL